MAVLGRSTARGFTLIELLVVIAIIGLLASVVLASLNTARQKARDARRVADIKSVKLAMELYYDDNSKYIAQCSSYLYQRTELSPYVSALPRDLAYSGTGDDYRYCGNNNSYGIRVRFESPGLYGSNSAGYCKTGVNINPGWWGTGVPTCKF